MNKNVALITAGGIGSRLHAHIPKQFINVNDKPIIVYTLQQFQNHPDIDAIYVSCLQEWENVLDAYARQFGIAKLKTIVPGGSTGQESIRNALIAAANDYDVNDFAVIHDGNRATVTQEIISEAILTAQQNGSAITAIPCVEVVAELAESGNRKSSKKTINRDLLMRTQTPHVYPIGKLLWAHDEAAKQNLECAATPELMCKLGEEIFFSKGSNANFKITEKEDLELFKAILNARP